MKTCPRCKLTKPFSAFYADKHRKGGFRIYCIPCTIEMHRNDRENNPDKFNSYTKKCRDKTKANVMTHYGNGVCLCLMCGENRLDCLTIDHINGGGTKHLKSLGLYGATFYRWLISNNYPIGYQTLCANCQLIKKMANGECRRKGTTPITASERKIMSERGAKGARSRWGTSKYKQ